MILMESGSYDQSRLRLVHTHLSPLVLGLNMTSLLPNDKIAKLGLRPTPRARADTSRSTYVNGDRLNAGLLKEGSPIEIGASRFLFRLQNPEESIALSLRFNELVR